MTKPTRLRCGETFLMSKRAQMHAFKRALQLLSVTFMQLAWTLKVVDLVWRAETVHLVADTLFLWIFRRCSSDTNWVQARGEKLCSHSVSTSELMALLLWHLRQFNLPLAVIGLRRLLAAMRVQRSSKSTSHADVQAADVNVGCGASISGCPMSATSLKRSYVQS